MWKSENLDFTGTRTTNTQSPTGTSPCMDYATAALLPGGIPANSVALVRERTIPTERPPLVGEVSANFCGERGVAWSVRRIPYDRNLGFLDRTSLEHSHKALH
jgi:hypothetical protein